MKMNIEGKIATPPLFVSSADHDSKTVATDARSQRGIALLRDHLATSAASKHPSKHKIKVPTIVGYQIMTLHPGGLRLWTGQNANTLKSLSTASTWPQMRNSDTRR